MRRVVFAVLFMLSINGVLLQTVLTDNDFIKNVVRIVSILITILIVLVYKLKLNKRLLVMLNISIILLLLTRNTDQLTYIFLFLVIQVLLKLKDESVRKYCAISSIIAFSLIFIFLFAGITKNEISDIRNRMTFGVGLGNVPFFYNMVYGTITLLTIYISEKTGKLKNSHIIIALITSTYFFVKTDIRGGYISILVFILLIYLLPKIIKYRSLRFLISIAPIFFTFSSFIIASFHNNYKINELLSLRPELIYRFLSKINILDYFFSTSVKKYDNTTIVDNSYLHILIGGGIIFLVLILYSYYKAVKNLLIERRYTEIAFLVSTSLYFNTESMAVRIEHMFIMYWWYLILKNSLRVPKKLDIKKINYL